MDLRWRVSGEKGGLSEEAAMGKFWRRTAIDIDTRLRVGRAIEKTEEGVALKLMQQVQRHDPEGRPPAIATDGKGAYREAMLNTWRKVPEYSGQGRPPKLPKPGVDWKHPQVIKERSGSKLVGVTTKYIYGDPKEVKEILG